MTSQTRALPLNFIREKAMKHLPPQNRTQLTEGTGAPHPCQIALEHYLEMVSQQSWNLEQSLLGKGGAGCSKVPEVLEELSSSRAGDGDHQGTPSCPLS